MTWEPTDDEINAYMEAERRIAYGPGPRSRVEEARAGLRAAYAELEKRLFTGPPTVLPPPVTAELIAGGPYEYVEVDSLDEVNTLAVDGGWRLTHVTQLHTPYEGVSYVLERSVPDPANT